MTRSPTARKVRPRRPPSEWNGGLAWPGAADVFNRLNALAVEVRLAAPPPPPPPHKGPHPAQDLADVLAAAAWMVNRNELKSLRRLATKALAWLEKAGPLVSAKTLTEIGGAARTMSSPRRTDLDAYREAVAKVERLLDAKPRLSAARLAVGIALAVGAPLPRVDGEGSLRLLNKKGAVAEELEPHPALVRNIERARLHGRRLDADLLVNAALRAHGIEKSRLRRLVEGYAKRPRKKPRV